MDKTSLEFYHIVNDNRRRKEEEWNNETAHGVVLIPTSSRASKKPNKVLTAIKYVLQGIGAIITGIVGFALMALMTLLV